MNEFKFAPGFPVPFNEEDRLAELKSFGILDTQPETGFDRITALASSIFKTPIALVSLIDRDRQWFKSRVGLDATESGRTISFCAHAILNDFVMVVPDASLDSRFSENALVVGEPFIRFYAGAPLISANGFRLGTLAIIDRKPRPGGLSLPERTVLRQLAEIVMREIELRSDASKSIAAMEADLEHSRAAKEKFLQLLSHELRTPLNAVIGFSTIIEERVNADGDTDAVKDYARNIHAAGQHLLGLINGMLEYASIERQDIALMESEVSLSELLETAVALLPDVVDRLHVTTLPEGLRLQCDPRYVAQIFAQIIGNAAKFSPEKAAITVTAFRAENGQLEIHITDSGPGIPPEFQDQALTAFEQLEDQWSKTHGGLGLGLAFSRKLMELHGGRLNLNSSDGHGTTVELAFPAHRTVLT